MESKNRQFIESFNPKLERLDSATNVELSLFYAGSGFDSFSKYIQIDEQTNRSEAMNDIDQGRGVTHLIYNYKSDGTTLEEAIAFFESDATQEKTNPKQAKRRGGRRKKTSK